MKKLLVALSLVLLAPAARADNTERTFMAKCASCHGEDGKGATTEGAKMGVTDMSAAAWQKQFTDAQLKTTIETGIKREKSGKKQEMEAYGKTLHAEQIDALIHYVRGLAK